MQPYNLGTICMMDPNNDANQKEPSIKFVQIMRVAKNGLFEITYECIALNDDCSSPIEVCNQSTEDELPKQFMTVVVDHRYLTPIVSDKHVMLRYPSWMPVFTHGDLAAITEALKMLNGDIVPEIKRKKALIKRLSALEVKFAYYMKMLEV